MKSISHSFVALFAICSLQSSVAQSPATLNNVCSIMYTIKNGTGIFFQSGEFTVDLDTRSNTYTLTGTSGGVTDSAGNFAYSKTSTLNATFSADDSAAGIGIVQYLIFTTPSSGTYSHSNAMGTQNGTFSVVYKSLSNDDFSSRATIEGTSGTANSSNLCASKETEEPDHLDNIGGSSVWWRWTAPETGTMVFDTDGSDFDTLLAVYTGGSVGELSLLASNDDFQADVVSLVSFTAVAGATYQIVVDGYDGDEGNIRMNWGLEQPAVDLTDLTYTTFAGKLRITDCDRAAKGELVIPDTIGGKPVTSIGNQAFYGCDSLTSIAIPDSVTSIGGEAFVNCTSLTSITIGDGVTSIQIGAFRGCTSLPNITIPDSVTSIANFAFNGCTNLTSITIPSSVTSIGAYAFFFCTSLTSITIPNKVTSIEAQTFFGCSSLTSITIPDGVTNIGFQAFRDCTSLTSITFLGAAPTVGSEAFFGVAEGAEVIVPEGQRASFGDGAATWNGLTVSFAPDVEWDSVISYRSVLSPESIEYIVGGNNIRRIDEGNVSYWAPSNAGEEALLTQRFSFNENIEQAYLNVSSLSMFNFGDGRFGRGSLWASKDGSNWVQLLDVPTPSETAVSKSYSSNLPPELLGGDSLWIQTRLLANGLNIMAQFLRYDATREDNAFDLKVRFGDPALSLTVSPEIENVGARGGSLSFSVSSDTNWSWSDDAPWLTSNESPSQSGSQEFSYSVAPNSSTQSRTATITFSAGEFTRTHTVTQQGIINCEISALRLPSGGLDALQVSFPARSGVSYRIEESSDLQVWDVREAGISGDGIIIQRRIPARGPKGFLRVVEE